jgi:uncharacterized protein (DUF2384 family)
MGSPIYPSEAEQLFRRPRAPQRDYGLVETFGDETRACHWMSAPRDIFEGRSPQELIDTGDPAEQRRVLTVLIRIDYGVFS